MMVLKELHFIVLYCTVLHCTPPVWHNVAPPPEKSTVVHMAYLPVLIAQYSTPSAHVIHTTYAFSFGVYFDKFESDPMARGAQQHVRRLKSL